MVYGSFGYSARLETFLVSFSARKQDEAIKRFLAPRVAGSEDSVPEYSVNLQRKASTHAKFDDMKPQEVWSRTYNHLWHGANTMLATTPTISRHLARTLVSSIPEDGMSVLATKLHCQKCSALMTDSKVRLRKPKKRPRRSKAVANLVTRTCAMCGDVNVDRGAENLTPSKACLQEIQELRERVERQRQRSKTVENEGMRKKKRKGNQSSRMVNDGRAKKKRRKGSMSQHAADPPSSEPKSGLAASFLFDPIP